MRQLTVSSSRGLDFSFLLFGVLLYASFFCISFFLGFFLLATPLSASAQINAGFVQGIWYSNDPFFAEREVRVYVALRNNADGDLTGTVRFLDNGELIDERSVSALQGNVVDTWVDWTPSYGAHKIEALLTDVVLDGDTEQHATVTYALAEDIRIVDYDTDGDGVGNADDEDDDGDGVSDEEELLNGTDPLVFDEEVHEDSESESENGDDEGDGSGSPNGSGGDSESGGSQNGETAEGLEVFLSDGAAKTALGGITSVSNNIKSVIDEHRENRADAKREDEKRAEEVKDSKESTEATPSASSTHSSSIGEITRSVEETEGTGSRVDIVGLFKKTIDAIYGSVLLIFSLYFAYPGIVQFTLLFLALLLIYHTARKLAKRPQD